MAKQAFDLKLKIEPDLPGWALLILNFERSFFYERA